MDDGAVLAVEFLDAGASGGVDEELDSTPPGRRPGPVLIAVGVLLFLMGAVVGVRLAGSSDAGSAAVEPPSATRSALPEPVPAGPSPMAGAALQQPCPSEAQCSMWSTAPVAVVTAVRAEFSGAQLTAASTQLVNGKGHFEPDLLARRITAQSGPHLVNIYVRKSERGNAGLRVVADDSGVRVFAGWPGYLVTVAVDGPGHPTRAAVRLAEDPRLLAAL
jgi:hypothetical protein